VVFPLVLVTDQA